MEDTIAKMNRLLKREICEPQRNFSAHKPQKKTIDTQKYFTSPSPPSSAKVPKVVNGLYYRIHEGLPIGMTCALAPIFIFQNIKCPSFLQTYSGLGGNNSNKSGLP